MMMALVESGGVESDYCLAGSFPMIHVSKVRFGYQSYLLRLWRSNHNEPWQISIQFVQTAAQWHFTSPEAFFHFLLSCMESDGESGSNRD